MQKYNKSRIYKHPATQNQKKWVNFASWNTTVMADNYIENKFEKMKEREAAKVRERQAAYRKRMEAYRRKLALKAEQEAEQKASAGNPSEQSSICGDSSDYHSGNHSDKE